MSEQPTRLHRFRPRLSRRRRQASAAFLAAGGAATIAAIALLVAASGLLASVVLAIGWLVAGGGMVVSRRLLEGAFQPPEYREARRLAEEGKPAEALAAVSRAVERSPDAFDPLTLKGMLLNDQGDFQGSLEAYQQAISRRPGHWLGYSGAGGALLNLGRLSEAVEELGKALASSAEWPAPRYQLGLALFLRGEYAGAAEALAEALALGLEEPTVELVARSLRAWALERTGSPEAARQEQDRARPLRSLPEIGAFRDRLRGARLSPVGKLAAWAVGVDTSDNPPKV